MSRPNLPAKVIVEILLRLPVKSLVRFASLSKTCRYLIFSYPFAKRQFNSRLSSNNEISYQNILLSTRQALKFLRDSDLSFGDEALLPLNFPPKTPNQCLKILGSCNGLVVVGVDYRNLFIYNPSIGHYTKVPDSRLRFDVPFDCYNRLVCGFGYESSSEDYILFFGLLVGMGKYSSFQAKIYSLRRNAWKTVEGPPSSYSSFCFELGSRRRCASVSGSLHWRLPNSSVAPQRFRRGIVAFDLKEEKFKGVPVIAQVVESSASLSVVEGKLGVITRKNQNEFELWLMMQYGIKESWTKLFSIKPNSLISIEPVWISGRYKNIVFVAGNNPNVTQLVRCLSEEENFKEFQICYQPEWSEVVAYKESLISPNFLQRMGRSSS